MRYYMQQRKKNKEKTNLKKKNGQTLSHIRRFLHTIIFFSPPRKKPEYLAPKNHHMFLRNSRAVQARWACYRSWVP